MFDLEDHSSYLYLTWIDVIGPLSMVVTDHLLTGIILQGWDILTKAVNHVTQPQRTLVSGLGRFTKRNSKETHPSDCL